MLSLSKCNHKLQIMKLPDIKTAHIYCKENLLSGQVSGPLIEHFIKDKYAMSKNKASLCIGDLQLNHINLEIKVSNGGKNHHTFNYVQIRMNHVCDYILTAYYLHESNMDRSGELFIFRLNKKDMQKMILKYGGYAHGTVQKLGPITAEDLDSVTNDKEYAIRPKYGDKCWRDLLQYRIRDIATAIDTH